MPIVGLFAFFIDSWRNFWRLLILLHTESWFLTTAITLARCKVAHPRVNMMVGLSGSQSLELFIGNRDVDC